MPDPVVNWSDMVTQCEDLGLLAKKLFVVFTSPTNGLAPVMEKLNEHLAFQKELQDRGIMFGAGPFPDDKELKWDGDGMVIIRAESIKEATEIAKRDPMHSSGARSFQIRPWLLNEGKINIELTFSDKSMALI